MLTSKQRKNMRKLLAVAMALPILAVAEPVEKEAYVQLEPNVQIIIMNRECTMWPEEKGIELKYAYATNIDTGDKVEGCFTHDKVSVYVHLRDDNKNHYDYKFNAEAFSYRPATN
jgi:hypothetical protein